MALVLNAQLPPSRALLEYGVVGSRGVQSESAVGQTIFDLCERIEPLVCDAPAHSGCVQVRIEAELRGGNLQVLWRMNRLCHTYELFLHNRREHGIYRSGG
jgi:hypothetical protein